MIGPLNRQAKMGSRAELKRSNAMAPRFPQSSPDCAGYRLEVPISAPPNDGHVFGHTRGVAFFSPFSWAPTRLRPKDKLCRTCQDESAAFTSPLTLTGGFCHTFRFVEKAQVCDGATDALPGSGGRLRHACLLAVEGVLENDGQFEIVTEYCGSGSLRKLLASGGNVLGSSTNRVKTIVGIVLGMTCMHANGIVHRDLRPENILIDDRFEVKIGDFGMSDGIAGVCASLYEAPEAPDSRGAAADVFFFSFGFLLYEILFRPTGVIRKDETLPDNSRRQRAVGRASEDPELVLARRPPRASGRPTSILPREQASRV